ncbi:thioredoxin family protein [Sinanaerobacter chloroacetimidivorans]|uniref:Thioredoxin family protein n=1 Tax=Sinanaerobacter chloroacetimidivorans TaxID=2818044 RepID=A0A8J8B2A0_9FIRM|nr:thioredoxin family protein [Sinanaerobacter chloroacetimidivorans]MBR0598507.1 thioredoxin family protein [Sinanaerobacter chloroacetimidivorans]
MHEIIIIGTVPPCPRCKLLTDVVTEKAKKLELIVNIQHISYTSEEAAELAERAGLKPGTAKDVAKIIGQDISLEKMPKASELSELDYIKNLEPEMMQFESLFREVYILDNWLRNFENRAKAVGILMTPALVIDGEIKYNGSVPDLSLINELLGELKR